MYIHSHTYIGYSLHDVAFFFEMCSEHGIKQALTPKQYRLAINHLAICNISPLNRIHLLKRATHYSRPQ